MYMGKKNRRNNKIKTKNIKPFVSICTPTFNRRPFFEYTIKCYLHQDYPCDKLEWIIIDDGTDKIEDLVKDIPGVKYFTYDEKMTLGKKRNLMHEKSKGDIIVYMDDDDYYPPNRVSHAVEILQKNKRALCAGSSEIYIWFKHIQKMYQFGPYGPRHATAGTFAFKRELLKQTNYEEHAALAEEKHFLKNYTIPFVQLDPKKTILVFSHNHNTFDKKRLLQNLDNNKFVKESTKTVDDFIKDADMKDFYMNQIEERLNNYDLGLPKYKPDVLKQTKEIEEKRQKQMKEHMMKQMNEPKNQQLTQLINEIKKRDEKLQENNKIFETMKQQFLKQQEMIGNLQKENEILKKQMQTIIQNNNIRINLDNDDNDDNEDNKDNDDKDNNDNEDNDNAN